MDSAKGWHDFFHNWPKDLPRRGVVVTDFGEQIPFESFLVNETVILLNRKAPDTIGARQVLVLFGNVSAVKIVDVVEIKAFSALGFQGSIPSL